MQDGIIKGTGNSRYLKSVADFLTQYPKYEDMVAALVAGTLPIDLNGINTAGWSQQATALNKANLLSNTTETAIWGSATNRTVDAALRQLDTLIETAQSTANSRAQHKTGTYSGDRGDTKTISGIGITPLIAIITSTNSSYREIGILGYTYGVIFRTEGTGWLEASAFVTDVTAFTSSSITFAAAAGMKYLNSSGVSYRYSVFGQ